MAFVWIGKRKTLIGSIYSNWFLVFLALHNVNSSSENNDDNGNRFAYRLNKYDENINRQQAYYCAMENINN
jgi:hypothetical protein